MNVGEAFGRPGVEPRWARSNKDGVGTAYSAASRIWFTLWRGIVTEVYYPTIDRPQLRDLQYLISDGTFVHEEKRDLEPAVEWLASGVPGYRVRSTPPDGSYRLEKEVISDPHVSCLLMRTALRDAPEGTRLYALCAPHLEVGGLGNHAEVVEVAGRRLLAAHKGGTWLVLGASIPFAKMSCGYVGASDGWSDLAAHQRMEWEFTEAHDGNVALTGELDPATEFTLGMAFGESLHQAATALFESLRLPFEEQCERYAQQWARAAAGLLPLDKYAKDGGRLYRSSVSVLLSHEDKTYPGALVASLSIPWGEERGDDDIGGYHLVWTRDMVNSATALLAAGHTQTALRALVYLAVSQQEDGGFPQNFWIDGQKFWVGVQLDEMAFPIVLAWRLWQIGGLGDFDPYPMVCRAAGYLMRHGPATQQERWEENSGYSPSTLAVTIAALICAGTMARARGEFATAAVFEDYADFLECHVEDWTVAADPGPHYVRINPNLEGGPDGVSLTIANRSPGEQRDFPASDVVDAGFLELVRYGVRRADDPVVVASVALVDERLRVETPYGAVWRRYDHDGYGQRADGRGYVDWGIGRAWPLLSGERGHYELAAGADPTPYLAALEAFSRDSGLLPEQVWDEPDRPDLHMWLGRPTGSAMPLAWAHAEYIKLLRSAADGGVFDLVPEVAERYLGDRTKCRRFEVWKPTRRVASVRGGDILRIQADRPFSLRWSGDGWESVQESHSVPTGLGVDYVDVPTAGQSWSGLVFTFWWVLEERWAGIDHEVVIT